MHVHDGIAITEIEALRNILVDGLLSLQSESSGIKIKWMYYNSCDS